VVDAAEEPAPLRHRVDPRGVGGGKVPPGVPVGAAVGVLLLPAPPSQLRQAGRQAGQAAVGHLVGVGDDAAGADHVAQVAVQPPEGRLGEPVERGGGHDGVEPGLGEGRGPGRAAEVGPDDADPGVAGQAAGGDGEEGGVDVDGHGAGAGEAGEHAAGDRPGAAGEVEHQRLGAGDSLDDVDEGAEPGLAVGHVALLLEVPRALPRLGPLGVGAGGAGEGLGHRLRLPVRFITSL
jgi:hypothetical protein